MENKRLVMCTSDGCIDIAGDEYQKYGVDIIRVHITFKGKEYLEGYDLDPAKYYAELETLENPRDNLPRTSLPSIGELQAKFDNAIANGYDEVFVVVISSGLSGTFGVISKVAEEYEGRIKIHVIDSRTNSFNEGLMAIKIAKWIGEGMESETILKEVEWIKAHQEFFGIDGQLDYLIYNGRLKGGKALIAKMLSICPVLGFGKDGYLTPWENVRTAKKAINRCCEILKEKIGDRKPEDYVLWHCYTGPKYVPMIEEIEKKYGIETNHHPVMMSPSSGSHNGPWFIGYGLTFLRRDDEPLE